MFLSFYFEKNIIMLSNSSKYAIRAVLFLSINSSEEKKYSPQQIADEITIPTPFLAKTLQQLARHHIISSTKGRNGGFYLSDSDRMNPVISIIEHTDGLEKINSCFLGLPRCDDENPCAIHYLVSPMRNNLVAKLQEESIGNFAKEVFSKDNLIH